MMADAVGGTRVLRCQCEHHSHFADYPVPTLAHDYREGPAATVAIKTPWGTFQVCPDCANTHMVGSDDMATVVK